MRTCPICGSSSFDDMPICFGCMHDFLKSGTLRDSALLEDGSGSLYSMRLPLVLDGGMFGGTCGLGETSDERYALNVDVMVSFDGPGLKREMEVD